MLPLGVLDIFISRLKDTLFCRQQRLYSNLFQPRIKESRWPFSSLFLFLVLRSLPCLPKAASNQRALSSQKGHPVPLMVFWFISSSPLPPALPFHPFSLTGKLESHYHQGAKKGLVASVAEWRLKTSGKRKKKPTGGPQSTSPSHLRLYSES